MILRLTVAEAAAYLGRRAHWVYNTLPKVCTDAETESKFITAEIIDRLAKFAFMSRTYESYPYDKITLGKIKKKLNECKRLKDLKGTIKTKEEFAELLIALRLTKSKADMFNLISYTRRKLGAEDWMNGETLKEFVYNHLRRAVAAGQEDLAVLLTPEYEHAEGIAEALASELTNALTQIILQDCAIKRK